MKTPKIDFKKISGMLRERCPFIHFAMLSGFDEEGQPVCQENRVLYAFIAVDTGSWKALEQILQVVAATLPDGFCEVTLLNRVDAAIRFRAIHGICLFVQEDKMQHYRQFVQRANLDYRIMRALGRRMGSIEND